MFVAATRKPQDPMPPTDLFTPDYKDEPYWWQATPRPQPPAAPPAAPAPPGGGGAGPVPPAAGPAAPARPARAGVGGVVSGFPGLWAAVQPARGGRHTVVIDAEDAGWGCSS